MDLHNYARRLQSQLDKVDREFCEEDRKLIHDFVQDLQIAGIKPARIQRYLMTLRMVKKWVDKPFQEWGEKELKQVLLKVENNGYTVQTINEYRKGLRKFFRWLKGKNWEPLELLRGDRKDTRKPDFLTEEEISRMINAAVNARDRAIIALGYEAGLRIGELASLRWGNIIFTDWGARIKVNGKTGERVIPVVMASSYLRDWMIEHPSFNAKLQEIDPSELVFVRVIGKDKGKPLSYPMFSKIIKKAAEKAGIKKKVFPHILRHSRATFLANHLTEQQMNIYFGWVQGSDMPSIYVHLSGRDIESAVRAVYGLEEEEKKTIKPAKCPRCGEINTPQARFCHKCGLILDEKERLRVQMDEARILPELMSKILESEELREKFKTALQLVEKIEGNPKAMEMIIKLVGE